ncbi:MAG TPA: transporter substrate-binding domain-containing protein [Paludibacteraceae bacterium]|jgi:membrane-bound lytic murein transglycosylase MltF|nr:transporter substrate-binding domain-containing protein [Paludibacteraceae bacterium]HRS68099.1 transporter substrate-binding domain-containing protein [Paludibacteraceae bacterium]
MDVLRLIPSCRLAKKQSLIAIAVTIVLVIVIAIWVAVANQARDLDDVMKDKTLRVVTEYSSIGYFIEDDQIKGFQYELIKRFADTLGVVLDFTVEPDLKKSIEGVNKGNYDLILRALPVTLDLKKELDFSEPLLKTHLVLVQRIADKAKNEVPLYGTMDLDSITIYVTPNSPYLMRLKHIEDELGVTIFTKSLPDVDTELLMAMVARGEIDYTVADEFTARFVQSFYPELDIHRRLGFKQFQAWGFSKHSPKLQQAVNEWLKEFTQTKAYRNLYRTYYR